MMPWNVQATEIDRDWGKYAALIAAAQHEAIWACRTKAMPTPSPTPMGDHPLISCTAAQFSILRDWLECCPDEPLIVLRAWLQEMGYNPEEWM